MRVSDYINSRKWPQFIMNILNVAFIQIVFNQIEFFICHFGGIPPLRKTLCLSTLFVCFSTLYDLLRSEQGFSLYYCGFPKHFGSEGFKDFFTLQRLFHLHMFRRRTDLRVPICVTRGKLFWKIVIKAMELLDS
jgi:hypothetical protein